MLRREAREYGFLRRRAGMNDVHRVGGLNQVAQSAAMEVVQPELSLLMVCEVPLSHSYQSSYSGDVDDADE